MKKKVPISIKYQKKAERFIHRYMVQPKSIQIKALARILKTEYRKGFKDGFE